MSTASNDSTLESGDSKHSKKSKKKGFKLGIPVRGMYVRLGGKKSGDKSTAGSDASVMTVTSGTGTDKKSKSIFSSDFSAMSTSGKKPIKHKKKLNILGVGKKKKNKDKNILGALEETDLKFDYEETPRKTSAPHFDSISSSIASFSPLAFTSSLAYVKNQSSSPERVTTSPQPGRVIDINENPLNRSTKPHSPSIPSYRNSNTLNLAVVEYKRRSSTSSAVRSYHHVPRKVEELNMNGGAKSARRGSTRHINNKSSLIIGSSRTYDGNEPCCAYVRMILEQLKSIENRIDLALDLHKST